MDNTCKNCIHYQQSWENSPHGSCDKSEIALESKSNDKIMDWSDALGNAIGVGENFGCIHFEKK